MHLLISTYSCTTEVKKKHAEPKQPPPIETMLLELSNRGIKEKGTERFTKALL